MVARFFAQPDSAHARRTYPLIGITGKAGSGKDTVGIAIQAQGRNAIQKASFAAPLKVMIGEMLGVSYDMMEGVTERSRKWREEPLPDIGKTPRELLLSLGTEWGRDMVHPDLWVILGKRQILESQSVGAGVYFTDVRFQNEADMIREMGGVVIKVVKDGKEEDRPTTHRSELGISPEQIDGVVTADPGDIDGLQTMSLRLLRCLKCPLF